MPVDLTPLYQSLDLVATRDRHRLFRQLEKLKELKDEAERQLAIERFNEQVEASKAKVSARRDAIPALEFPEILPVSEKREEIAQAIRDNQIVVIAGETGSGKTTQLPKICLSVGRGTRGLIGHTQPRRLAARSVANRIAEELSVPLGDLVGYQVRFTDQISDSTAIKLMTDGILLAEIQNDPYLNQYDTLIIDEAHERSLNIDFLLGYLKQLLVKRKDLKLIITSATIDVEKFSQHFSDAPIIEVSGRTFPVEVLYRPLLETESDSVTDGIVNAIHEITTIDNQGDILVFLSGEREIRETALQLRREQIPHLTVVPLYARLSIAEQNKIFQPHRGRRVVLSTNVAETSLTVPGIRYVIDPGFARISRYSFRTKVQRLPIEPISQASANQRKGRCGRVSAGVCIRLYSEEDFNSRPEFTDPEILRTNLAAVILQMAQLRLGDVRRFPFIDMPDHRLINDGYRLLQELQAINGKHKLTRLGRQLGQLPVDPRFARMLLAGSQLNCLNELLIIVSALSIQDPRERPAEKQQAADQKHREYWHDHSDFMAYVTLWNTYEEQRQELSNNQLKTWCKKQFLSSLRMREWRDIHKQLLLSLKPLNLAVNHQAAGYDAIHKALITGLLGNIGLFSKEQTKDYLGARNRRFSIFPASSQFKKTPQWIVAAELLETSRLFAHNVAKVEPEWILKASEHLVKRQHIEPHYNARSGQVMVYEKISLYGLVLVEKKSVSYSHIDAVDCRKIFIRSALVEGAYLQNKRVAQIVKKQTHESHFFLWQQQLLDELHKLEAKSRRRDIIADDEVLYEFYDQIIPADIINLDGFERWRKTIEHEQPKLLFVDRARLMQSSDTGVTEAQFPDSITMNDIRLAVVYQFDPGHSDDGVTLKVPVSALHLVSEDRLEWLVPGLLGEKVTAMIKALPKQWRKQFAPVPSAVEEILPHLKQESGSLVDAIIHQLNRFRGVQVPLESWQDLALEDFYRFNIQVLDERGKVIDRGRNLQLLRERYRDRVQQQLQKSGGDFEKQGLAEWNFGALPETFNLKQNGMEIRVYPGLKDQGSSVDLALFDHSYEAVSSSVRGMVRLALLSQSQTVKYLHKQLLKSRELGLAVVDMGNREQVIDDILCATVRETTFVNHQTAETLLRSQSDFIRCVEQTRSQWVERAEAIADILVESLRVVVDIKQQGKRSKNPLLLATALSDIQQQLGRLFYKGCLYQTPYEWLKEFPRYLKAIQVRLEKVPQAVNKDRFHIDELEGLYQRYEEKSQEDGAALNSELQKYRWMLEELRVSLFAQTLGTSIPVSVKRLNKQWELC